MAKKNQTLDDDASLEGLRKGNQAVIEQIYAAYFPRIAAYVCNNQGRQDDAKDIFQEALMVMYHKSQEADFSLSKGFFPLLMQISKHIWLKRLRKNAKIKVTNDLPEVHDHDDLEKALTQKARLQLFEQKFTLLSEACKTLLTKSWAGESMKQIAQQMGWASEGYARKRKHQCKQKLVEFVSQDPLFEELKSK